MPTLTLKEADIQRTICDLLRAEGWRVFEPEQQWSEKKRKTVGEKGMPDVLAIRYECLVRDFLHGNSIRRCDRPAAQVIWLELKRIVRGKPTKTTPEQRYWHRVERARGALTLIAGIDFPATIEGFREWYRSSGLQRR